MKIKLFNHILTIFGKNLWQFLMGIRSYHVDTQGKLLFYELNSEQKGLID
jgi:hypothetical protein